MATSDKELSINNNQKNIYSRIEPDLRSFTVDQLLKALEELDSL